MAAADEVTVNAAPARPTSALFFIVLTIFIDMLGIGILIPVIPFVVTRFGGDALTIGLLSASFAAFQFIGAPILGQLSDRHGRRPLLLVSLLGTAIGWFAFGAATTLTLLFAARILDGLTGGNISIAQAYIADVSRPADRSKNFGLVGAAFSLGFIIGPAIGGALSHAWGLSAPAYFAGTLALANTVFGYFMLPESLDQTRRRSTGVTWRQANPLPGLISAMTSAHLGTILAALFAFNFAAVGLQSNFVLFSFERFNWGPGQNAVLFSVIGVLGALMQGVLMRRLVHHFSDRRLALVGLSAHGLMLVGVAVAPSAWMLFPICGVMSLASGMSTPIFTGMISKSVSAEAQGATLGITQSVSSLTRIFGPLWAGFAYSHIGRSAPYWSGALILAIAAALVRSYRAGPVAA